MSAADFQLDPRLAAETTPVAALELCDLRLMNDARFAWLVLVPRRHGCEEITDLPADEQALLWQEVNRTSAALRVVAPCDKLNLGALGNIVRQLHVHVVARVQGDPAWPGPVWGSGAAVAYAPDALQALAGRLRHELLGRHQLQTGG